MEVRGGASLPGTWYHGPVLMQCEIRAKAAQHGVESHMFGFGVKMGYPGFDSDDLLFDLWVG